MTENRDDFEHRLGQGLKRWAEAGEPALDLEALVTARPRRRWLRWATVSVAAALLLVVGGTFTFPAWAGTAAAWPVIGPVIQEMIMKDAGLKWAYDAGLMQGTLAEASQGGITVRILAVVPDQALTTILYQVTGLPDPPAQQPDPKPIPAAPRGLLQSLSYPVEHVGPLLHVKQVPGNDQVSTTWVTPMHTPMGIFGTVTTSPVGPEGGQMVLEAEAGGQKIPLSFPVSRSAADRLTVEHPVHQTQTIDEITYTVEAVIQTPVQTVVRYQVTKPEYGHGYSWSNHEYSMRLEGAGEPRYSTQEHGRDGMRYALFPKTELPARLVLPATVKGVPVRVDWPLQANTGQLVAGVQVTLTEWEISGNRLGLRFKFPVQSSLVAFGGLEAVDASGKSHPLKETMSSWSDFGGVENQVTSWLSLPEGVTPIAVRATQIAVPVQGPWVFDLPAK